MKTNFSILIFALLITFVKGQDTLSIKTESKWSNFNNGFFINGSGFTGLTSSDGIKQYLIDKADQINVSSGETSLIGLFSVGLSAELGYRGNGFEIAVPFESYLASRSQGGTTIGAPQYAYVEVRSKAFGLSIKVHQSLTKNGKTTMFEEFEIMRRKYTINDDITEKGASYTFRFGFAFNNQSFNVRPHIGLRFAPLKDIKSDFNNKTYDFSSTAFLVGVKIGFCIDKK